MKPHKRAAAAAPQPLQFPVLQVTVGELIDRIDDQGIVKMLEEQVGEAWERYVNDWFAQQARLKAPDAYKLKPGERTYRGALDHDHPMFRGRWATANGGGGYVSAQLDRALKAKDWQEVMVLAGMLCVREMLYGRAVVAKPTPAPKVKAVRKTAQKKPAAKKPGSTPRQRPSPESAKKVATLKDLVAQAKPLFEKNPKLDRQGLINKIGRRYERLTTFDELRTLCAGKTVTTHSVKKTEKAPSAVPPVSPSQAQPWPFATGSTPPGGSASAPKPKRARRDPARPVELPESSIPKGVRTKPWPTPDGKGNYTTEQSDHVANFSAGDVAADFAVIETENGWTYAMRLVIKGDANIGVADPLTDDGPLALNADTAIRNVSADLLAQIKNLLKRAEAGEEAADRAIVPHIADLEKLRTWLLGFQARGVEKIAFLKKSGQLELAA